MLPLISYLVINEEQCECGHLLQLLHPLQPLQGEPFFLDFIMCLIIKDIISNRIIKTMNVDKFMCIPPLIVV